MKPRPNTEAGAVNEILVVTGLTEAEIKSVERSEMCAWYIVRTHNHRTIVVTDEELFS